MQPYYVAPGPVAANRILLISYHAPPSNQVGALRWTAMARHFAAQGWGFDIMAVDPAQLPSRNESLLAGLPSGTRLFAVPDDLPMFDRVVDGLARLRNRLARRGTASPPSIPAGTPPGAAGQPAPNGARRVLNAFHAWREYAVVHRWAHRAAVAGRMVFDPAVHRWVISSGPPHMSHEGGRLLAEWTGLPFMADFRDAWRFQEWVPLGPAWRRLATKFETQAVNQGALTVVTAEPVRALMQRAYPGARIVTITNGIDDDPLPAIPPRARFIVGYPGTVYVGRDPAPLFEAVANLVRRFGLTAGELGLEFMGFSDPGVEGSLRRLATLHGLEPFLEIRPGGPRPQALEFMATCSVLVALQQGSDLAIPAKVFECMRFPAWLLVLAGAGSATSQLLAGTGADVLDPGDTPGIQSALAARFEAFRTGVRPAPLGNDERFARRYQAGLLMEAMDSVTRAVRRGGA